MTWGAEDLAAALGASDNRGADGNYDDVYKQVKGLCLAACRAIDVQPVGVLITNFRDDKGLEEDCLRDRKAGFVGKIAIHPAQPPIINKAFTPSEEEIAHAKRVVAVFAENPGMGDFFVCDVSSPVADSPAHRPKYAVVSHNFKVRANDAIKRFIEIGRRFEFIKPPSVRLSIPYRHNMLRSFLDFISHDYDDPLPRFIIEGESALQVWHLSRRTI